MKNPATHTSKNELNAFTQLIHDRWIDHSELTFVKLRDGTVVQPIIFLGEDTWEDDYNKPRGFNTSDWSYCWNLDGTSVTRFDYDMMELM